MFELIDMNENIPINENINGILKLYYRFMKKYEKLFEEDLKTA
jgi:hypothetical protein